jgi:large subunit ribosomal protein L24
MATNGQAAGRPAKLKVRKGDTVLVIAGKDKGAKGKVLAAFPERQRVVVEGVNRVKKHVRVTAGQRGAKEGGIEHQEAPIHVSNVAVLDSSGKRTRLGFRTNDEGAKTRVARRTGEDV